MKRLSKKKQNCKSYSFTEEWSGNVSDAPVNGYIYILDQYYEMFQYFLNFLRANKKIFYVLPLELYKEKFSEQVKAGEASGYEFEACTHLQEDGSWILCIEQYVMNKKNLYQLGHEIAHIILDNLPECEPNGYLRIDYKAEYQADIWSYEVLHEFGYLTLDQTLKLTELSQLQFMEKTKVITGSMYDQIVSLPMFKNYDRKKGLFSDKLCGLYLDGQLNATTIAMIGGDNIG